MVIVVVFFTINSGITIVITHGHLQFIKYITCGKTMPRTTTNFTSHGWIIIGLPPIFTILEGGTVLITMIIAINVI